MVSFKEIESACSGMPYTSLVLAKVKSMPTLLGPRGFLSVNPFHSLSHMPLSPGSPVVSTILDPECGRTVSLERYLSKLNRDLSFTDNTKVSL